MGTFRRRDWHRTGSGRSDLRAGLYWSVRICSIVVINREIRYPFWAMAVCGSRETMEKSIRMPSRSRSARRSVWASTILTPPTSTAASEAALGEALRRLNCRDKVYIADKLPQYLIKSKAGIERCFQEQLSRLKTDRIDFYLMHMLTDLGRLEQAVRPGYTGVDRRKERQRRHRKDRFLLPRGYRHLPGSAERLRLGLLPDPVQLSG